MLQPGSEFGATNKMESAVKDITDAIESLNRAITKLHEHTTGICTHGDTIDTSTMGTGPRTMHCNDCSNDFVLIEE